MRLLYCYLLMFVTLIGAHPAQAQLRALGLGLRLSPDGGGLSAKVMLQRGYAVEGLLNVGGLGRSYTMGAVFQYHFYLPDPSWRIFFGGGAHTGFWERERRKDPEFIFGIDGIGGVEYLLRRVPLGISGDFKPAVNFVEEYSFFAHNIVGFAARYYFGRAVRKR